jgi:hypothetical protein
MLILALALQPAASNQEAMIMMADHDLFQVRGLSRAKAVAAITDVVVVSDLLEAVYIVVVVIIIIIMECRVL